MFFWVSTPLVGEVDRVDDTVVLTKFVRVNGMPLAPDASFVRYQPRDAVEPIWVQIPLVGRSIAAAYLPRWGVAIGFMIVVAALVFAADGARAGAVIVMALGVALAVSAWPLAVRLGRLPADEVERRRIYGAWIGPAIDPAMCGRQLDPWVDRLRGVVAAQARGAEMSGYRSGPEGHKAWFDAALASDDAALWGAAFTLARAEMTRTRDPARRAALERWHDQLWRRLSTRLTKAQAAPGVALLQDASPIPGEPWVEPPSPFTSGRAAIGVAATIAAALSGIVAYDYAHPTLLALNVSAHDRIVISVDGKWMGPAIAGADRSRGFAQARIGPGEHVLEARDAVTGEVIDRTRFDVGRGRRAVLYAPGRRPGMCVIWARATYGERMFDKVFFPPERRVLDPSTSAWALPAKPDYVLEALPEQIQARRDSSSETRSVVDVVRCPRPDAEP